MKLSQPENQSVNAFESLLKDAYKAMTSSLRNPSGLWRRTEDAEVLMLANVLDERPKPISLDAVR